MPFPTTDTTVAAAEHQLAISLPTEYRERLISVNGGELATGGFDWAVFPVLDISQPVVSGRTKDIVTESQIARKLHGFPAGAVAIASNTAGDLLVFMPSGIAKKLDPQVQMWSRETHKCKAVALHYDYKL